MSRLRRPSPLDMISLELLLIVASYVVAIVILTRGLLADLRDLRERSVR